MAVTLSGKNQNSTQVVTSLGVFTSTIAANTFDVFELNVTTGGMLKAETSPSYDTLLYLFDSSDTQIAFDDDSAGQANSVFTHAVTPGTYYVLVAGFSAAFGTCNLTLSDNGTGIVLGGSSAPTGSTLVLTSANAYNPANPASKVIVTPTTGVNTVYTTSAVEWIEFLPLVLSTDSFAVSDVSNGDHFALRGVGLPAITLGMAGNNLVLKVNGARTYTFKALATGESCTLHFLSTDGSVEDVRTLVVSADALGYHSHVSTDSASNLLSSMPLSFASYPATYLPPVAVPPSNIKIGYGNLIDKSVLAAMGVSLNLPVNNLKSVSRGQVFRGLAATQTIDITFASASKVGAVALWLPKQSWTTANTFDALIYNGATVVKTVTGAIFSAFFAEVTATKAVITIHATTVFDLSRIFIGRVFEPVNNLEFGFSMKYKDLSTSERTEDGSLHIVKKAKFRTLSISLADITHGDRQQLIELVSTSGTQNDVFVSVFNGDSETNSDTRRYEFEMLGVFEDGAELALTSANRWSNKLVVNEL